MMATIGRALRYRPLRQGDGTLTQTTAISTQTIVPTLTTKLFVSEIERQANKVLSLACGIIENYAASKRVRLT